MQPHYLQSVRAHHNPHEMPSRIKQALTFARPQLHVSSCEYPTRFSKPGGNPSPVRASLRDGVSPGAVGTSRWHRMRWAGTSRLAPGQPKHHSPHLCKSSVYFYAFVPSCASSRLLHTPFPLACAGMSRLSPYVWLYL